MDTQQFLIDQRLAQRVVGRKLHELIYPEEWRGAMSCPPLAGDLTVAPEIPRGL